MLERKGIDHDFVALPPGLHPVVVRLVRFPRNTVPALRLDGRRIQGSLLISRALEDTVPAPALFPADPERRRAVEEAEAWGDAELQPIPRRVFRWAAARRRDLRRWLAEVSGIPGARVTAATGGPMARAFARASGADEAQVRADVAALPGLLDRADALIAEGTIGGAEPNAADFQIAPTLRYLLEWEDLGRLVEGRPAADLARRLLPDYPGPVPALVPPEWIPAVGGSRGSKPATA